MKSNEILKRTIKKVSILGEGRTVEEIQRRAMVKRNVTLTIKLL